MTGAHEEVRLLEPADRTSEVRAVDREDLKLLSLHPPHPARNISCLAIPRARVRVSVLRHSCLVFREISERSQRDPGCERTFVTETGEDITEYGDGHEHGSNSVKKEAEL